MTRYAVLGSGSSANAYIFESDDFSFVVDNGFSAKEFLRRAEEFSFDPGRIRFIFATHTHRDHLSGIDVLSRKLKVPVVRHESLALSSYVRGEIGKELSVLPDEEYRYRDLVFTPFSTSHDAPYALSYHFTFEDLSFLILTDTGTVNDRMRSFAAASDVIFLEANYNETMLRDGPYPYHLKQRIASERGHLSNSDAVGFLNTLTTEEAHRLRLVYFCHLSDTNNTPEQLKTDIESARGFSGEYVICRKSAMQMGLDPSSYEPYVTERGGANEDEKDEERC